MSLLWQMLVRPCLSDRCLLPIDSEVSLAQCTIKSALNDLQEGPLDGLPGETPPNPALQL